MPKGPLGLSKPFSLVNAMADIDFCSEWDILDHWNTPEIRQNVEEDMDFFPVLPSVEEILIELQGDDPIPISTLKDIVTNFQGCSSPMEMAEVPELSGDFEASDLTPSNTNEVGPRQPGLKELRLSSAQRISGKTNSPHRKKLRPLSIASSENRLMDELDHAPFRQKGGRRVWCCREHKRLARNARERKQRAQRNALQDQKVQG